jgi:long-chain acyl-CoA synthetase
MTIGDLIVRNAKRYPHKEAIIFEGMRCTYKELNERVNRLANALLDLGGRRGDRVAVLTKNRSQSVEIYLASGKCGMAVVPINWRLIGSEISYVMNNSEASALILQDEFLNVIEPIRPELKTVKRYICIGGGKDTEDYEQTLLNYSADEPRVEVSEADLLYVMYTSGTTGAPKGAMLTQRNMIEGALNHVLAFEYLEPTDTMLLVGPFFHMGSVVLSLTNLYAGGTMVILEEFNAQKVLETIQREKVTVHLEVPTMVQMLVNHPGAGNYDLSSLRRMAYSGSPMPMGVLKEAMSLLKCPFVQFYSMTESATVGTYLSWKDHILTEKRIESAGKEMMNVEMRVVDDNDEEVGPGEVGEILLKGDCIMQGYWKLPRETEEALKGGWFHTGDLVKLDEEGFLYLVDRKKDFIISGAENIYSKEIENVLYLHPAVLEAAVIAVPDEKWGEAVKALIVLRKGMVATGEEIIDHCKKHLASFKKPRSVELVESFPKSPLGKIKKDELREKYWRGYTKRVW